MKHSIFLLAVSAVLIAGCQPAPRGGIIGYSKGGVREGATAPVIPFTANDGRATTLSRVREEVGVLIFTKTPEGKPCNWIDPRISKMADDFSNEPVTIIQVTTPTKHCPHGPGCLQTGGMANAQMIGLCDEKHIAWDAYGQPANNTVFVLDENNTIRMIGALDNLQPIVDKVNQMADAVDKRYRGDEAGIYIGDL